MGYIIKDNSALISSVLTDAGRRAISRGNFNISYFQVGDSEVCYDCIENANLSTLEVLSAEFNAQNKTSLPEKNQMNIKYPLYVDSNQTSFFGIPFSKPEVDEIYNSAAPRDFFTGTTGSFYNQTSSTYVKSANWTTPIEDMDGSNSFTATYSNCTHLTLLIQLWVITLRFGWTIMLDVIHGQVVSPCYFIELKLLMVQQLQQQVM